MMDFTTPRYLAATIYGDETGCANQMLVEVDQPLWDTIVALHTRSKEMGTEFGGSVELALSTGGHAMVLNDIESDEVREMIPDSVSDWLLDLDSCSWFEGDPADVRKMLEAMEADKEATGREYTTQPVTLSGERIVVEAFGTNSWSLYFRFEIRKSEVGLESADLSELFTITTT